MLTANLERCSPLPVIYMEMTKDEQLEYYDSTFEALQLIGADERWSVEKAHKVSTRSYPTS